MTDKEKLDMAIGYLTGKILGEQNFITEAATMLLSTRRIEREVKIEALTYAVKVLEKARREG
jgi:hypothetical protein